MKERPILMSTDMVRAELDGRKTMTRRVIKPQPPSNVVSIDCCNDLEGNNSFGFWNEQRDWPCPYGQPGDRLWVRETFISDAGRIYYRASLEDYSEDTKRFQIGGLKWKSGRFMFKKYARIWLEITSIRIERVQDISADDCIKEGVVKYKVKIPVPEGRIVLYYQALFVRLWDSLNKKRGYGWDKNPWVWVIGFERLKNG